LTADDILDRHARPVPCDKSEHLYIYAIVRNDLEMPPGKLAAQAGHAYTDALCTAQEIAPESAERYRIDGLGGSKVTLKAKNLNQLLRAYNEARAAGLPCAVIVDREHVLPPHFDGNPIITAIGIGPCTPAQARAITRRYQCL
jgi:PTH2 family peptidyl-tRNA hydrolase